MSGSSKAGHCWMSCPGQAFNVRCGPNYEKNKKKLPSGPALYEVYGVDAYSSAQKLPHVGRVMQLPEPDPNAAALGLPSILIINFMIPNYPPSGLMKKKVDNGPGWNLIIHCRVTDATLTAIKEGKPPPSVELFKRFIDPVNGCKLRKSRLKCIFGTADPSEPGFNMVTKQLVQNYNFKPFLSKTASSFYSCESHFEIDVDIHTWGHAALSGFNTIKSKMSRMVIRGGIVIEADGDAEMPEQALFGTYLSYMDPTRVDAFPPHLTTWLSDGQNYIPPLLTSA